jgi:hypothetical protein
MIEMVVNAATATDVQPIILGTGDFLLICLLLYAYANEFCPFIIYEWMMGRVARLAGS